MLSDLSQLRGEVSILQSEVSQRIFQLQHGNYLHSAVIRWNPVNISAHSVVAGYVGYWNATKQGRVLRVQVWMGNPYGITWEGDIYVTKNSSGDFQYRDSLLVHYQFDKHVESPIPHQLMFDLTPGFPVSSGERIYVWRLFHNISPKWTLSGDGEVIIYYVSDWE